MNKLVDTLIKKNLTVATCESCTGGLLSAALTSVAGASAVYVEGAVTYSNEAKIRLGVNPETIKNHGAVSSETAYEMAECIKSRSGADAGISVTGIAGPGGATAKKPIGLVFIGIATKDGTHVFTLNLSGSREQIRSNTVDQAILLLFKFACRV